MSVEHFDVLIVGAGLSGIGAGYFLQTHCPSKSYAILEGRSDLGGTWDLFRYPGLRSDSDMFTLGYSFRPWHEAEAIANGPSILKYIRATAREFGIDRNIRFQHRVLSASWSSAEARWTVECSTNDTEDIAESSGAGNHQQPVRYTCSFLYLCSGYYNYESGHTPVFRGAEDFQGPIVHPQHWPRDLDCSNRRVVVIGSGATAVTLVPALAETAAHVIMLQRSPTYIVSLPSKDPLAQLFRKILPERAAHRLIRWKNVLLGLFVYSLCQRRPELAKRLFRRLLVRELPPGFDIDKHFTPHYEPWDQRVCVAPDADLFRAIRDGRVIVVTDQIKQFTLQGILLESGQELLADVIVTATGLKLLALGGIRLSVDGAVIDPRRALTYKGLMLSDVPNCAFCVGYSNASWTLRADLSSMYVCRLINYLDQHGYRQCTPRHDGSNVETQPLLGLKSGYVQRGVNQFPKQGTKAPWVLRQNYLFDLLSLHYGRVDDGALVFSREESTSALSPAGSLRAADQKGEAALT
ncbi:MAG TPA: NAD(P)/FAD-dependent oxidoreductase [Gemmataceae bacterium]|nr:NAD(P)/FAD-dependent oxidoreductase [Gemmataceae bacterium]